MNLALHIYAITKLLLLTTDYTKMADDDSQRGVSSCVLDYTALFCDGIGSLLERLDSDKEGDIMDELIDGYDMASLMDMRLKVFRYAKAKLIADLEGPSKMDIGKPMSELLLKSSKRDIHSAVAEWVLVARRGKQRVVKDTIDLMGFMSGRYTFFPHDVLKRRRNRVKKAGVATRLQRDPKQPMLPFSYLEDEMDASDDVGAGSANNNDSGTTSSSDEGESEVGTDEDEVSENVDNDNAAHDKGMDFTRNSTPTTAVEENERHELDKSVRAEGTDNEDVPTGPASEGALGSTDSPKRIHDVSQETRGAEASVSTAELPLDQPQQRTEDKRGPADPANPPVRRNDTVTCDAQSEAPSGHSVVSSNKEVDSVRSGPKSNSIVMATQTEWDLWGSPMNATASPMRIGSRSAHNDLRREWEEWKAVNEKESLAKLEQTEAKMNILRRQQLDNEAEIKRLNTSVESLSRQLRESNAKVASSQLAQFGMQAYPYPTPLAPPMGYVGGWMNGCGLPGQAAMNMQTGDGNASMYPRVPAGHGNPERQLGRTVPSTGPSSRNDTDGRAYIGPQGRQLGGGAQRSFGGAQAPAMTESTGSALSDHSGAQRNGGSVSTTEYSSKSDGVVPQMSDGRGATSRSSNGPQPSASDPNSGNRKEYNNGENQDVNRAPNSGQPPAASTSWVDDDVSDAEIINVDDKVDTSNDIQVLSSAPDTGSRVPTKVVINPGPSAEGNTWSGGRPSGSNVSASAGSSATGQVGNSGQKNGQEKVRLIVTRNGWKPANSNNNNYNNNNNNNGGTNDKKRKQSGSNDNRDNKRVLTGGRNAPNRDIFVLNLEYSQCTCPDDLVELVKEHCRTKGVGVVHVKVFTYDYDSTFANCRVTVKEFDEFRVLQRGFWPQRASARVWLSNLEYRQKQRADKGAEGENAGGE